jgi:hypothetical protein
VKEIDVMIKEIQRATQMEAQAVGRRGDEAKYGIQDFRVYGFSNEEEIDHSVIEPKFEIWKYNKDIE